MPITIRQHANVTNNEHVHVVNEETLDVDLKKYEETRNIILSYKMATDRQSDFKQA